MDNQPVSNDAKVSAAMESVSLFFWVLKSMKNFNDQEMKGVLISQLKPTDEENCFLAVYMRAVHTVDSMLALDNVTHFQAVANLSRTMLELAADAHLLSTVPEAAKKFLAFNQLERLRAARGIVTYAATHALSIPFDTTPYKTFITLREMNIEQDASLLWPNMKLSHIKHWTTRNLEQRTNDVGEPLQEIYQLYHRILSWHVHSGGSGVMGLPAQTFPTFASVAYRVAALTFEEVIKQVARFFNLHLAIDSLEKKLEFAKALPLTTTPEQELRLAKDLGLM